MIDWGLVYQRLMNDFKTEALLSHLILAGGGIIIGAVLGYIFSKFMLFFLFIIIGVLLDFIFFGKDWTIIFTKKQPYVFKGFVKKKIKQATNIAEKGDEKFFFIMEIIEANILDKEDKSPLDYKNKLGQQKLEVQESMYLSLQEKDYLQAVCTPFDEVWGVVKGEQVIEIEY